MNRQLKGIALILLGIQLTLVCMIDPWFPIIGDVGRIMLPILTAAVTIWGLVLVFAAPKDQ